MFWSVVCILDKLQTISLGEFDVEETELQQSSSE